VKPLQKALFPNSTPNRTWKRKWDRYKAKRRKIHQSLIFCEGAWKLSGISGSKGIGLLEDRASCRIAIRMTLLQNRSVGGGPRRPTFGKSRLGFVFPFWEGLAGRPKGRVASLGDRRKRRRLLRSMKPRSAERGSKTILVRLKTTRPAVASFTRGCEKFGESTTRWVALKPPQKRKITRTASRRMVAKFA